MREVSTKVMPLTVGEIGAAHLEGVLKRWKRDKSIAVKVFQVEQEPFRFPKFGDKKFTRFVVDFESASGPRQARLVLRQLPKQDIATIATGDVMHRELQAVRSGLLRDLHCGLYVPYIEALERPDHDQRWVWMEDVTEDVKRLGAVDALSNERLEAILSDAAGFHAINWARQDRLSYPWLLTLQGQTASFLGTLRELLFGAREYSEVTKWRLANRPWLKDGLASFWPSLEAKTRVYLEGLVRDPQPFFDRWDSLPHTIVHGDFDQRNMGVHIGPEGEMTTVIDWELISHGHSSMDVSLLLAYNKPKNANELLDHYLDSLGRSMKQKVDRAEWRVGYDLATINHFLTRGIVFGLMAKHGMPNIPEEMRPQFVARAQSDADKITEICQRIFG